MTNRADLRLKTLHCTISCIFLKIAISSAPSAKITECADLGLKTLFCTNLCTLMKICKLWRTQCGNDKPCWSRAKNSVLYKHVHFAENRLKVVHPVRKWGNVLISGRKRCFVQTRALWWKLLENGVLFAKMTKRSDFGLKTLFCKNLCTLQKMA